MVKILFSLIIFAVLSFGEVLVNNNGYTEDILKNRTKISILIQKIQSFVSEESYLKNEAFIKLIFSPSSDYFVQDRVDVVKVVQTLKENGLLNLFFDKPQELNLSFKTSGAPLFFVKVMGDTLRNIGYYRYVTQESNLDHASFTWSITLKAEYATDPLILQEELQKNGCRLSDIVRNSQTNWEYTIDMTQGNLNVAVLESKKEHTLKRSLYAHWLNVEKIQYIKIKSSFRDRWYPKITYYDKQLHLLKVITKDKRTRTLNVKVPKNAKYIKISDIYTLKNVKDKLTLEPRGLR